MSSVKLLGLARLRQVRVRRDEGSPNCHLKELYKNNVSNVCTPKFSANLEAKNYTWSNEKGRVSNMTAWDYVEESQLKHGKKVAQWAGANFFKSIYLSSLLHCTGQEISTTAKRQHLQLNLPGQPYLTLYGGLTMGHKGHGPQASRLEGPRALPIILEK